MRTQTDRPEGGAAGARPRGFGRVATWIFDLDNTLYSPDADLWPRIDARITLYLSELFGIDGLSARALQKYYYRRYGTTLKGLMEETSVPAEDFLAFVHDIDRSSLQPDAALAEAIGRLPGRKLVLTNGSREHALRTMERLGIGECFEDVFDIAAMGFAPKPELLAYERFLARHGVDPGQAAIFEDIARNLVVPHDLGMTTVLVTGKAGRQDHRDDWEKAALTEMIARDPHIDWTTDDLAGFLNGLPA